MNKLCQRNIVHGMHNTMSHKRQSGFTLIELMIVVMIVGILAAIAYPNYTQYVIRSHRADGQQALMNFAQLQEQWLLDNRQYATLAQLPFALPASVAADYTLSQTDVTVTPPFFKAVLTPIAGGMMADDGALSINSLGELSP